MTTARTFTDHRLGEIDVGQIADALQGRKGGLRPSKPTTHDGLTQYVWRMARLTLAALMRGSVAC